MIMMMMMMMMMMMRQTMTPDMRPATNVAAATVAIPCVADTRAIAT